MHVLLCIKYEKKKSYIDEELLKSQIETITCSLLSDAV